MANKEATLWLKIKQTGAEALDGIKSKMFAVGAAVVAVTTAIVAFVAKGVEAYREQELATTKLSQAMINAGMFSDGLRQKYLDQAAALQKLTLFGDEAIIAAQATLQTYVGQQEVTEELTRATLDLAQAKGLDLTQAAEMVGRAIGGGRNALAAYGIEVDTSASRAERLKQVLAGLKGEFNGNAEAAAAGLGSIERMKNSFGEVMEAIGAKFAPVILLLAHKLSNLFDGATASGSMFQTVLDVLGSIAGFLIKQFMGLTYTVTVMVEEIWTALGTLGVATKQALTGNFSAAKDTVSQGLREIKRLHDENNRKLEEDTKAVDEALSAGASERYRKELDALLNSNRAKQTANDEAHLEKMSAKQAEAQVEADFLDQKFFQQMTQELMQQAMLNDAKLTQQLTYIDAEIAAEDNRLKKIELIKKREQMIKDAEAKYNGELRKKEVDDQAKADQEMAQNRSKFLSHIATMQSSHNQVLATIGKAAAIAQITINTAEAAMSGYKWGMAMGGPPLAAAFAGLAVAAGSMQAAKVAGVQLAEGGVVLPRNGGTLATIGEAGSAEAVIPLDDPEARSMIGGGGITVNVFGGLLGDESSAHQLAVAIDKQLLKLRQGNESVAFDSAVT